MIANVERFRSLRHGGHHPQPEIGIAFVAMKRNIADLPEVLKLGLEPGRQAVLRQQRAAGHAELQDERLYMRCARNVPGLHRFSRVPRLSLPKMDFDEVTRTRLFAGVRQAGFNVSYAGNNWGGANDVCNYIEGGSMTVAWNGDVSPCWPLMHTHMSYLHGKPRVNRRHVVGNVCEPAC